MNDEHTIWDHIDFNEYWVDPPYYEDVPDATPERELATEICRRIPRGWWSSYGDLARAYRLIVVRERLDDYLHTDKFDGHWLGTNVRYGVDDARRFRAGTQKNWSVPWHRMRDMDGFCRTPREPDKQIRTNGSAADPEHPNYRWVHREGGRLTVVGGQASPALRVDMCEAVRRGLVVVQFV